MKTGGNNQSLYLFIIALAFACVSLWSTTDLLRKNDQATILAGAHDWVRGERQAWSRYYQFDKTYILYAYTAAVLKANHVLGEIRDPVWLGNHVVASAFWLALFVFIGRFRKTLSPLALCATLAAPAILFNTQYVNSTVLSSAFFLLALAALGPLDHRRDGMTNPQGRARRPCRAVRVKRTWLHIGWTFSLCNGCSNSRAPARLSRRLRPTLPFGPQGRASVPSEPLSLRGLRSEQARNIVLPLHAARRVASPYRWLQIGGSALCLFLAVGARADVILLLPLWFGTILGFPTFGKLCAMWFQGLEKDPAHSVSDGGLAELDPPLAMPPQDLVSTHGGRSSATPHSSEARSTTFPRPGKNDEKSSKVWKNARNIFQGLEPPAIAVSLLGSAAVLALLLGGIWAGGAGTALDPFFQWKMVLGYVAFGFGGATVLFVLGMWGVWRESERGAGWMWALAVALPVFFFLPQLHAPRYFWRGAEVIWMLSALAPACLPLGRRWLRWAIWVAVLAPLVVGLHLPVLTQPRLTVRSPTLFPSGDGHYPMGAYALFLRRMRHGSVQPIDHNQRVWAAVQSASFEPDASGRIPVLFTPMFGYFMLEASLRGYTADYQSIRLIQDEVYYMDSRTLARQDMKFSGAVAPLLDRPIRIVSPEQDGISVLRVGQGDAWWGKRARLLNRLFAGNEYRIVAGDGVVPVGHPAVWFAEQPFDGGAHDEATGWYYSRVPADTEWLAWTVLPGWMSVQAFVAE